MTVIETELTRLSPCEEASFASVAEPVTRQWKSAAFLGSLFALMLWGRWTSIGFPISMNVDEAQSTVSALRLHAHGFAWSSFDGGSNGFFDSLPLAAPYLFGMTPTLTTTRVICWVLLCVIVAELFGIARRISGSKIAAVCVIGYASHYGFSRNADYLHYASEFMPVTLALGALWLLVRRRPVSTLSFGLVGALLAAAPLAKLQIVPITLPIWALAAKCWFDGRGTRLRHACAGLVGMTVTFGVAFVPAALDGGLDDVYTSYFRWAFAYIVRPLPFGTLVTLPLGDSTSRLYLTLVGLALAAMLIASIPRLRVRPHALRSLHLGVRDVEVTTVACGLAALYSVRKSGYPFLHYYNLVLPFIPLLLALAAGRFFNGRGAAPRLRNSVDRVTVVTGLWFVTVLAVPTVLADGTPWAPPAVYRDVLTTPWLRSDSAGIFAWVADPDDSLLVWGFEPDWYLDANLLPPTPEAVTFYPERMRKYYSERLLRNFDQDPPAVVVDSESSRQDLDFSIEPLTSFPELRRRIERYYVGVSAPAGCPFTFVRRDRYLRLTDRLVPLSTLTGTTSTGRPIPADALAHLVDGSVTESRCEDYLALEGSPTASLSFAFASGEEVQTVMLLNTRNGLALNLETQRARVTLLEGTRVVAQRDLTMAPRPQWTEVAFTTSVRATSLRVELLSGRGGGVGLNEVKVFRAVAQPGR